MEFLKCKLPLLFILFFAISCGGEKTITQTIKVRVDTYISNVDNSNHSELSSLLLSKSSLREDRIILKLPTNDDEEEDLFDKCFEDLICVIYFMPAIMLVKILTTCENAILSPANLTSAILILNTEDGSAVPAGTMELDLLDRPWWHTVNWQRAHPFASSGRWATPGGDIDSGQTFDSNCTGLSSGSCAAGEIKFELTDYFRTLIQNDNTAHYGILIYPNIDTTSKSIYSVQAASALSPRIVASYTGSCTSSLKSEQRIYYLGTPISIR